tara:strand:+ start:302 stop:595 length:294 start_codon:yes stop_codon:yes gene_type:complete
MSNLTQINKEVTKKDLIKGTKFMYKYSDSTVFTFNDDYINTDILLTDNTKAIQANQYNVESLTDKYLKIWDIQFGQKKVYKVKLQDIQIIEINYRLI